MTPKQLARELAGYAQRLRLLVLKNLKEGHGIAEIYEEINQSLTEMGEDHFADSYAQSVTYGLFAARLISDGRGLPFTRGNIADLLPSMGATVRNLFLQIVKSDLGAELNDVLCSILSFLETAPVGDVFDGERDPVIHFYQDFLDAYDPQIRKDQGVYYTPDEVVSYIVRTAHASLQDDFGLPLGLADTTSWADFADAKQIAVPEGVDPKEPFVQLLDPATGTGTFLLRVIEIVHETMQAEFERQGLDDEAAKKAWVSYVRKDLLPRINGFELMMAPYIVSHLRLGLALQQTGFVFQQDDRLCVFLTNTLEMHTPAQLSWIGEHVAEEAQEAERVKKEAPISVIVGNPPYEREPADSSGNHKGGWVRSGWKGWRNGRALLEDYTEPTRNAGDGGHLKNIYNLYVYFWRWATWRVFDRYQAPGIVSFITASSYLRGPGFSGMREEMRRAAQEVFIFDLEGDLLGARKTENVFNITIPVCVGTMVLATTSDRTVAGASYYQRVTGAREEKLEAADEPRRFTHVPWSAAPSGWQDVLMAGGSASTSASYDTWPAATEVFPWQQSGCKAGRTWVIGEAAGLLEQRWSALMSSTGAKRVVSFKNSPTGQKAERAPLRLPPQDGRDTPIAKLPGDATCAPVERFGFRSFDRHWIIADIRVLDRPGPPTWYVRGPSQMYLTSLLTGVIGEGPAATASAFVPDLHHFRGSYGGKDVIPLWRDPDGETPNLAATFSAALAAAFGTQPEPEDIFAYAYAVLANPGYVARFEEELHVPGPRLPVTKDKALFDRGASLGRELLRWHTYGERFRTEGDGFTLSGIATVTTSIPSTPADYPEKYKYDEKREVLQVGAGEVGPVSPEVWAFSVSGLQVVKSWLSYRMKKGAGRKSSPLDDIRPERWTDEMTRELLELLWVLDWSIAKYPEIDAWLDDVLEGDLFTADEIPPPTDAERKAPKIQRKQSTTLALEFK